METEHPRPKYKRLSIDANVESDAGDDRMQISDVDTGPPKHQPPIPVPETPAAHAVVASEDAGGKESTLLIRFTVHANDLAVAKECSSNLRPVIIAPKTAAWARFQANARKLHAKTEEEDELYNSDAEDEHGNSERWMDDLADDGTVTSVSPHPRPGNPHPFAANAGGGALQGWNGFTSRSSLTSL
eukprot:m.305801 g.305801  ORF g.305801 m.305801 type:complete len:186 (+) comp27352_c0_seq3:88-645(+)